MCLLCGNLSFGKIGYTVLKDSGESFDHLKPELCQFGATTFTKWHSKNNDYYWLTNRKFCLKLMALVELMPLCWDHNKASAYCNAI